MLSANLPGGAAFILDRHLRCLRGGEAFEILDQPRFLLVGHAGRQKPGWRDLHALS